jgi:hypothetical protein
MDATEQVSEDYAFDDEQAVEGEAEDQSLDTLESALDALEDDSEPDGEPQGEEPDAEPAEEDDSVMVTLDGDEKVTLKDLKAGYFRQRDYTQKTTEVAQERKAVEATKAALAERTSVLETALQNLGGYLQGLIPPEPPLQLAQTDPGRYQYQRALRENAIAELGQLVSIKGQVDTHNQAVSEAELREYRDREQAALVKAMPALADPVKRVAFDQSVKTAAKAFGFTDDEISATADHRILRLVHFARLGQKAEENRNNAKKRIETPRMGKATPAVAPVNVANKKAMHALTKSGNWKDALRIDFE